MENGTDFAFGKADPLAVAALRQKYGIRDDDFVFLFVGRMRWYKNLKLILDSLKIAREKGLPFRALFVGSGYDAQAIRDYADECGLRDCTVFTGPIYDREQLRAYYSLADLFLFPSTYDTSGIVVKEAAACSCRRCSCATAVPLKAYSTDLPVIWPRKQPIPALGSCWMPVNPVKIWPRSAQCRAASLPLLGRRRGTGVCTL